MSTPTTKSFADIREDYAFFETHATEAAADVRAYIPHLKPLLDGAGPLRLLDFGCGSGRFSSRLHSTLFFPPERLRLTLVEPDNGFRKKAVVSMMDFTAHPIMAGPKLPLTRAPIRDPMHRRCQSRLIQLPLWRRSPIRSDKHGRPSRSSSTSCCFTRIEPRAVICDRIDC